MTEHKCNWQLSEDGAAICLECTTIIGADGLIESLQTENTKLQEEIAALRAAAIQPVMSRQGFGTPGTIEFYRCVFCNHDARTPDIDHDSDCAVREARYLGGVE